MGCQRASPTTKLSQDSTSAAVRRNWHRLSIFVALNQGCVTTPRCFATSLLDQDVGFYGSALLYIFTCLCSLFVSCPLLTSLGQRYGLFLAMVLYSLYVGLFALATSLPAGSDGQWATFLPASCLGGAAASLLWTAQGGYFGRSVTALTEAAQLSRQSATAEQASVFAAYFLAFEGSFKLLSACALSYDLPPFAVFMVCLGFGAASSLGAFTLLDFGGGQAGLARPSTSEKLLGAVRLWADPVLWCLAPTNLTFGFSAAFLHGYVNARFTKPQLGAEFAGYFAAATAFLAAVLSQGFGLASVRTGSKGPFVLLGSGCFLAIALVVSMADLSSWGLWLVVPYALQGCGRAVYESTNRGVWADLFPGAAAEGAFANMMVQTTLSFAFTFFFSAKLPRSVSAAVILALAAVTLPGYLLAHMLRRRKEHLSPYGSETDLCDAPRSVSGKTEPHSDPPTTEV